jgi:flagellar secretion chaperone FliS
MKKGHDTYKEINTLVMSQLELILTVYRGAINFLQKARRDFTDGKADEGHQACERARRCIVHLYTTLDMDKGEAIAARLGQLYAFMIEQLDLAAAQRSSDLLVNIISMLETIKEGWESLRDTESPRGETTPSATSGRPQNRVDAFVGETPPTPENRITISA